MIPVENLLKILLTISSLDGNEIEICLSVYNLLEKEGFLVKKYFIDTERFTIVASIGSPKIYLEAHLDTVSPDIEYREDDTYIYGRGSCDTKGAVASMITAAI